MKELRAARGLTQEELAKIMDVDPTSISKYELNRRVPSLKTAVRIASFFGVRVEEIFPFKKG